MPGPSDDVPDISVTIEADGSGEVAIGTALYPITEGSVEVARRTATAIVQALAAQQVGGPVRARTCDPDGPGELTVYPDGTVQVAAGAVDRAPASTAGDGSWTTRAVPTQPLSADGGWWPAQHSAPPRTAVQAPAAPQTQPSEPTTQPAARLVQSPAATSPPSVATTGEAPTVGRHARQSFIAADTDEEPASVGFRGALSRSGIRTKPSRRELALRDDVLLVSQHWVGPRTVAIANPKGSANKTPTTLCLAAVFGRYGGGGVLAWDNNETRGTAAWRSRQGPHEATVLDLLPRTGDLMAAGAQAAELARHVHHQPADKFDVLWSDQSTRGEHEVTGAEVDAIHEVASKYFRLVLMDSGNSERASNWRAMIRHAHSLVVPATNVEDTAEAGARMLEALAQRDEHSADLARNAVAIISQRTPGKDPSLRRIVQGFEPLVRTVVTIPHDPALYSGVIRFDALRPATQRAWLSAAAAVAEAL